MTRTTTGSSHTDGKDIDKFCNVEWFLEEYKMSIMFRTDKINKNTYEIWHSIRINQQFHNYILRIKHPFTEIYHKNKTESLL